MSIDINNFLYPSISILNKLTPEKFDKLCLELLNVGIDSKLVLKGIILLVSVFSFASTLKSWTFSGTQFNYFVF